MEFDINKFVQELDYKLNIFSIAEATIDCEGLIKFLLESPQPIPLCKAEKILQLLRNKRMFLVMQKVADILMQTNRISHKIQRQYAQSLIDSGNYTAPIFTLQHIINNTTNTLASDTDAQLEYTEAKGLIGRVYKQLYINANAPANSQCIHYITQATRAYYEVYSIDKSKVWHGINVVALLERAKRDNINTPLRLNATEIAEEILEEIQKRYNKEKATAWDYATAAEACIALNQPQEAIKWLSGYARMPDCDAFELGSTLRQFEEVWQLDLNSTTGQYLLPLLRSELIKRKGGNLTLNVEEVKKQSAFENKIDAQYAAIIQPTAVETTGGEIKLEKVFGNDSFKTYKWYMQGAARCLGVARIGLDSSKGFGTGFLLKGKDIHDNLGDDFILVTNAHVVSNDADEHSLKPDQAIVIFEALNSAEEFRDLEIAWTSPINELDTTILRFSASDQTRLKELTKSIQAYKTSKQLPVLENPPTQKVYVIGHPFGGTLQISFQDNLLIDYDKISKIHYRTPTEGGSSGSPVFNQQWDLIGLHHAGSKKMPCLNGKPGTYEANEGIWIEAIKKSIT